MTQIADSVALVAGSNRGLGAEFVRQALARGARKVYATARHPVACDDSRVVPPALYVTREDDIRQAPVTAADTTIVVNNAGTLVVSPVLAIGAADVRRMFETDIYGPIWMWQAFAPVLARNGGGAFVNLHSVMSWSARGGAYSATKAAFWSFLEQPPARTAGPGNAGTRRPPRLRRHRHGGRARRRQGHARRGSGRYLGRPGGPAPARCSPTSSPAAPAQPWACR